MQGWCLVIFKENHQLFNIMELLVPMTQIREVNIKSHCRRHRLLLMTVIICRVKREVCLLSTPSTINNQYTNMIPESLKNVKLLGEYLNLKQQKAIVKYFSKNLLNTSNHH